jgi:PEP-CTERM motif
MKTFVTIGLMATGVAFAAAQPAQAASLVICASTSCGSPSGETTFSLDDFEHGFTVNGSEVQIGLHSPASTTVPQAGSFVDGAAKNTFAGSWIDEGMATTESETVFFTDRSGGISDVLNFNYGTSPAGGGVSGFIITGMLSAADLAAAGITPTATAPEGKLFTFNNAFITASVQTAAIPEPSTWAMMLLGFVGLGYAGWRRGAKTPPALA